MIQNDVRNGGNGKEIGVSPGALCLDENDFAKEITHLAALEFSTQLANGFGTPRSALRVRLQTQRIQPPIRASEINHAVVDDRGGEDRAQRKYFVFT